MAEVTINGFIDKTFKELDTRVRRVKIAVFSNVLVNTRVDTGRMAGNWQISNAAPLSGELDRLDPTYQGGLSRIQSVSGIDSPSFMVNNLDYAEHWNRVDGYVDMAQAYFSSAVAREIRR